uniref:Nucleoprotein TPR n=1 Tax=Steinernema glaseri TaxID=37863 RepID=A0A1I7ZA54_9BILA
MEDELLFRNIEELHEMNVKLRERLRVTEKELEDAIANARNDEAEKNVEVTKRYEARVQECQEQMRLMGINIEQLQEQLASYKKLAEQAVSGNVHSTSPLNNFEIQELRAEKDKMECAYESLRERFEIYRQERSKADEVYEQRIEQQIQLIGDLRALKAKLEADIVAVQNNAQAACKQVLQTDKDLLSLQQRLEKANTDKKLADQKYEQITQSLMTAQEEIAHHKTNAQILQAEVEKERRSLQRVEAELQVFRNSQSMNEHIARTLSQLDNRLKYVDDERSLRTGTQVEALTVERDNLKTLLSQMNDDVKRSMNDRELERQRYGQELELLKIAMKKAEQEKLLVQNENESLKTKVSALEKQFTSFDTESGDKVANQQVINRNDYLETQVRELEEKLDDTRLKYEAKEKELHALKSLTENIEVSLKQQDQFAIIERSQLQGQVNGAHAALSESRDIITRLRNQIATLESQSMEKETTYEQKKYEYEMETQEMERRLNDMERERNELAVQVDDLSVKIVEQEGEMENVRSVSQALEAQLKVLNQELAALRTELDENRTEAARYKTELAVGKYESERLLSIERDEIKKLRDLVASHEARDKDHSEKVDVLYNKIEELVKRLTVADTVSSSMMNSSTASMTSDVASYDPTNTMESMGLLIEYLRKEKTAAIERCSTAELKLKTAVAQATIDQEMISALEGNVEELNQTVQDLNNEKQIETNKAIDALNDLATERSEKEKWRQLYQQSEEFSANSIPADVMQLQASNTTLSERVSTLEEEKKKYTEAIKKLRAEVSKSESERKDLSEMNKSLRALAKKYKDKTAKSMSGDVDMDDAMEGREGSSADTYQSQYDELKKERDELVATIQKMEKEIEEVSLERDEAQFRLTCLNSINATKMKEEKEKEEKASQTQNPEASPEPGEILESDTAMEPDVAMESDADL